MCFSGIPGELVYVRHGVVNEYALSFTIPIKSDVTDIYFVWQSLHKSPPEPLVCLLSKIVSFFSVRKVNIDIGALCTVEFDDTRTFDFPRATMHT